MTTVTTTKSNFRRIIGPRTGETSQDRAGDFFFVGPWIAIVLIEKKS